MFIKLTNQAKIILSMTGRYIATGIEIVIMVSWSAVSTSEAPGMNPFTILLDNEVSTAALLYSYETNQLSKETDTEANDNILIDPDYIEDYQAHALAIYAEKLAKIGAYFIPPSYGDIVIKAEDIELNTYESFTGVEEKTYFASINPNIRIRTNMSIDIHLLSLFGDTTELYLSTEIKSVSKSDVVKKINDFLRTVESEIQIAEDGSDLRKGKNTNWFIRKNYERNGIECMSTGIIVEICQHSGYLKGFRETPVNYIPVEPNPTIDPNSAIKQTKSAASGRRDDWGHRVRPSYSKHFLIYIGPDVYDFLEKVNILKKSNTKDRKVRLCWAIDFENKNSEGSIVRVLIDAHTSEIIAGW